MSKMLNVLNDTISFVISKFLNFQLTLFNFEFTKCFMHKFAMNF